jgi:2-polyprenyl-3-methyl-5-hydroxy-6-metoxy-1,4-benzoquinol methylase
MTQQIKLEPTACSHCGSGAFTIAATGKDYIYHGTNGEYAYAQCSECAHFYLNPRPEITELALMYPSNYGTFSNRFQGRKNLLALAKSIVNQRRLKGVLASLPQGARALDVGCGNGELLVALHSARPDLELTGLDSHFPRDTRQSLESNGIGLIESPLESAQLPQTPFDLIILLQLVEHLWEPEESLRLLVGSLASGGRLLIETPNTDGWDRRFFSRGAWGGYYFPRHLNLYNYDRLAEMLQRIGLVVESQRSLTAPLIWAYSCQAEIQSRLGWKSRVTAIAGVRNLPLIAAFTLLDSLAMLTGARTSNQQAVSRKP